MLRIVGFDTETHLISQTPKKGQKRGVTIGSPVPRLVCLSWHDTTGANGLIGRVDGLVDAIDALFVEDGSALFVAHNLAFDLWVLVAFCHENGRRDLVDRLIRMADAGLLTCTQVREKLILNRAGYLSYHPIERRQPSTSLADCVTRYTGGTVAGKSGEDAWRLRYCELEHLSVDEWPSSATAYAALDARYCLEVFLAQQSRVEEIGYLDDSGVIPTEVLEVQASLALSFVSQGGIHAAPPLVRELKARLAADISAAYDKLVPSGLITRSVNRKTGKVKYTRNKKLIAERILAVMGEATEYTAPTATHPNGQVKDGAEELEKTGDPDLMALAEVMSSEKLNGTYIPTLALACVTSVHTSYQTFMETSRSSATAPNVQNQPRSGGVRECQIPCPFSEFGDWVLGSCDYSAQELVCFAQNAVDLGLGSAMADAINKGLDLHCVMGASIATLELGQPIDYENFVVVLKGKKPEHRGMATKMAKEYRQLAKAANFGLPGGMGAGSFVDFARASYGVIIDLEKSETLKAAHREAWPEMEPYFKLVGRKKEGSDYLVEHLPGGMLRKTPSFTAAANSRFQGRAAQMSKTALWKVTMAMQDPESPLYGCKPYAFVHDEILVAIPKHRAVEAMAELSRLMVEAGNEICPDVLSKAPPAIAYRWYKAMEEEFDADGNLIPWVPNAVTDDGNWLLIKDGKLPSGCSWADPLEVQMGVAQHLNYPRG